jgi:hypothetical protein
VIAVTQPIFPAAVLTPDAADVHPPHCACIPCTDALVARIVVPLVQPGPLTDSALRGRTDHPLGRAGEADARLDAAGRTAVREAPTGVAAPVGAGDSSPDRAAHPGMSIRSVWSGAEQGAAGLRGPAAPAPAGGVAA